ncbi:MAG: SdpI family protein, partial [Blastocatellia bacterium]
MSSALLAGRPDVPIGFALGNPVSLWSGSPPLWKRNHSLSSRLSGRSSEFPLDESSPVGLNTRSEGWPLPPKYPKQNGRIPMEIYGYLLMTSDVLLILSGATMYWFSPRLRRNWVLGYGSPRSMINDAAWQSANRFAGMSLASLALIAMTLQVG